jgi:anti-anti-sigma regulatory factor
MPSRHCTIFVGHVNGRALLRITGEIDLAYAQRLEDTLALIDAPLTVDCSRLDFLDASVLQILARDAELHGGTILRHPPPWLCRLVHLANVEHLFVLDPPSYQSKEFSPPMLWAQVSVQ